MIKIHTDKQYNTSRVNETDCGYVLARLNHLLDFSCRRQSVHISSSPHEVRLLNSSDCAMHVLLSHRPISATKDTILSRTTTVSDG